MEGETITQLAKRIGRNRRTVWLWIHEGAAVGGTVVKLKAHRIGCQWVISPEQYAAFVKSCNPGDRELPESPLKAKERGARERAALLKKLS